MFSICRGNSFSLPCSLADDFLPAIPFIMCTCGCGTIKGIFQLQAYHEQKTFYFIEGDIFLCPKDAKAFLWTFKFCFYWLY